MWENGTELPKSRIFLNIPGCSRVEAHLSIDKHEKGKWGCLVTGLHVTIRCKGE